MFPFACIVERVLQARRAFYRMLPQRTYQAPLPVIVVGNIYVGGTGKTPVVIALVQALSTKGWRPGVISRGYGIKIGPYPKLGQGDVLSSELGDEPALIARQTKAPVAVHPNRKLAIEALMVRHPEVNLIVSDDGLQHLALARDMEIVVQDLRGVGNGRVMPAGPLRENAARLEHVDAIVTNCTQETPPPSSRFNPKQVRQANMKLQIASIRNLSDGQVLSLDQFRQRFASQRLGAAAGIGMPVRFFDSLVHAGLQIEETLALEDHHIFTHATFSALQSQQILITAKDAIKCESLEDPRLWVVEVTPVFSDPDFTDWVSHRLQKIAH